MVLNVKALVGASRRFQQGEGPTRVLLRDCEIFANLRLKLLPVVMVVVVGGVMVVLEPGQVSRPGTAAASQSSAARANIIFRLSQSDQEESQEGSGASHSMI